MLVLQTFRRGKLYARAMIEKIAEIFWRPKEYYAKTTFCPSFQGDTLMPIKRALQFVAASGLFLFVAACSPEVGSKEWCEDMKEKPKADWSANEAADFTKSCIL